MKKKTSTVIKTVEIWSMDQNVMGGVMWDAKKQSFLAEEEEEVDRAVTVPTQTLTSDRTAHVALRDQSQRQDTSECITAVEKDPWQAAQRDSCKKGMRKGAETELNPAAYRVSSHFLSLCPIPDWLLSPREQILRPWDTQPQKHT